MCVLLGVLLTRTNRRDRSVSNILINGTLELFEREINVVLMFLQVLPMIWLLEDKRRMRSLVVSSFSPLLLLLVLETVRPRSRIWPVYQMCSSP
jgi:hypothetical protein